MADCPICQTSCFEGVNYCSNCGWHVAPYSASASPPAAYLQKDQIRVAWAREWWARSHAQLQKLQTDLDRAHQNEALLNAEVFKLQQENQQLLNRLSEFYTQALEGDLDPLKQIATHTSATTPMPPKQAMRVSYQQLETLLATAQWREADQETATLLLQLCDRSQDGWLSMDDLKRVPDSALKTLDDLWTQSSQGRFGFSVQHQIWQTIGGTPDAKFDTWCRFGTQVGWHHQGAWKAYEKLDFSLNAPPGSLPAAYCELGLGAERLYYWWWLLPVLLFSRVTAD